MNKSFEPTTARDFLNCEATYTVCALLDQFVGPNATPADQVVFQLNHVEIEVPGTEAAVLTQSGDRVWVRVRMLDMSGSVEVWLREKPALALSGARDKDDFVEKHTERKLSFPLLSSVRVFVRRQEAKLESSQENTSMVIMEAQEQDITHAPNQSVTTLLNFVKQCAPRYDGIVPATLDGLRPSSHYPLQVEENGNCRACQKALVFINATEQSSSTAINSGVLRMETHNVNDPMNENDGKKYTLIAMCPESKLGEVMLAPPRSGTKRQAALAVVTSAVNKNTFMLQSVRLVTEEERPTAIKLMKILLHVSKDMTFEGNAKRPIWETSDASPVSAAKKCRRLQSFPTDGDLYV